MAGPEAAVERYLVEQIERLGGMCKKMTGWKDAPDRMVLYNGVVVFVEVKAPGQNLRKSQARMLDRMYELGGLVCTVNNKAGVDRMVAALLQDAVAEALDERTHEVMH